MALLDGVREMLSSPVDEPLDARVTKRLDLGRARHRNLQPAWAEQIAFWQGRQFVYRDAQSNRIAELETREWGAKPRYRARTVRNRIVGIVSSEVSMATQRVPQYAVTPSTTEPEDINAARLGERVLQYLHDSLNIRARMVEAFTYAVVNGEGFLRPWWNAKAGDPLPPDPNDPLAEQLYTGELCLEALGPSEVYWEPGARFEKSAWMAIDKARPIDDVKMMTGFTGVELRPDAQGSGSFVDSQMNRSGSKANMVIVTEYLERPSPANPKGRRLMIANKKIITPPEPYPAGLRGPDGVLPCILKIAYIPTPDKDRDMGLVEHLIDPQRTLNDAVNKCVAGETLVTTSRGLRRADEINGTVEVLAGDGAFRKVDWGPRGTGQLWRVEFNDGSVVHATQNHRWMIRRFGKSRWVTTPMLDGLSVPVGTLAAHTPVEDRDAWWKGVQNGMMWGDGTVEHHKRGAREYVYGSICQYVSEDNLATVERFFPGQHTERREYAGRPWIQARGIDPALKSIPSTDEGLDYIRGFLAGAIATDGCVTARGSVQLAQKSREELEAVATLARTVGIAHRPITEHRGALGTCHGLRFDKRSFVNDSGVDRNLILKPYHQDNLEATWTAQAHRRTPCKRVISVSLTDRVEETYCCEEPVTNTWVLGSGLVTGNSIEWKNLALAPQWVTGPAGLRDQRTNEPGAVFRVRGQVDDVKPMPVAPIPESLFRMVEQAVSDMEEISSQRGIPSGVDASKAISVLVERDNMRRQFIVQALADLYSDLGKTLLWFVQQYFSEPKLLAIQGGIMGLDFIPDFKGADLRDQLDVRVAPASIEARTREAMEQKILTLAQLGWIDKQEGLAAMDSGTLETLVLNYEMNQSKQQREIHQMLALGDPRLPGAQVPIAKPFDDHKVHLAVLHTWMLSEGFESSPPQVQEAADLHAQQHEQLMAQADAQAMAAQNAQAMALGSANAAKPSVKPMPSLPSPGN